MSPDPADRERTRRRSNKSTKSRPVRIKPSVDDPHEIKYFKRHVDDDPATSEPARAFLRACDANVRAKFAATLTAVAAAPPHKFAGGGPMGGDARLHDRLVRGRCNGRDRSQHRIFCLIDLAAEGATKPWLVAVTGMSKPWQTTFSEADYAAVRNLGDEYKSRNPRSVS